jgi:hypothetical protein
MNMTKTAPMVTAAAGNSVERATWPLLGVAKFSRRRLFGLFGTGILSHASHLLS